MSKHEKHLFCLYVTGNAPNSMEAIANLTALCRLHLPNLHRIEIIDVLFQPQRALGDRIYLTPTLVKLAPSPLRQIIGNLSQTASVLRTLGLGEPSV